MQSVKRLTYPGIKVVMVIDGNSEDNLYMMDIFSKVMGRDKSATYIWKNNFHVRVLVRWVSHIKKAHNLSHGWLCPTDIFASCKNGVEKEKSCTGPSGHWDEVWITYR